MRSSRLVAVLLLATPFAHAQAPSTVVTLDPLFEAGLSVDRPVEAFLAPGGGVVSLFEASEAGTDVLVLRRLDERGDRVWTATFPLAGGGKWWDRGPAAVTSRGSTVFALHEAAWPNLPDTRIVSVDAAGQVEWDVLLPSSVGGAPFGVMGIGGAANGDVLVGGLMDDGVTFAGRATVRRLDGATSAEAWRFETPSISLTHVAFHGDRTHLLHAGTVVKCVDGQGNQVYSTTLSVPFAQFARPVFVTVGPNGEYAVGFWESYVSADTEIRVLDPAGALTWGAFRPAVWNSGDAVFTDSGDLVVVETGSGGSTATRYDAMGGVVWQYAGAAGHRQYRQVERAPADGVAFLGYEAATPYPGQNAKIEFVDALGNTIGQETFAQTSGTYGYAGRMSRDDRGNYWVGLARFDGGLDPEWGATVKVVPGGDPSVATCTQSTPNSSGDVGRLRAAGPAEVAADNLTLVADQLPPAQFVLFLNSRTQGFTANPGGSLGDLCLGGSIGRYVAPGQIRRTNPAGLASLQLDLPTTPSGVGSVAIAAGETWHFQAWHRDVVAGVQASNLTGALSVTFL